MAPVQAASRLPSHPIRLTTPLVYTFILWPFRMGIQNTLIDLHLRSPHFFQKNYLKSTVRARSIQDKKRLK